MDLGFALIAFQIENNPIAAMNRISPGYIRQEIMSLSHRMGEGGAPAPGEGNLPVSAPRPSPLAPHP